MIIDPPGTLVYVVGAAILLGWFTGKLGAFFGNKFRTPKRDPRDTRIRSLEADQRIARTQVDKTQSNLESQTLVLAEYQEQLASRDQIITDQHRAIRQLQDDLKTSVKKTRELRTEISRRAAENLKSESRLREMEIELSVAQASTDMIASGVLDYSLAPDPPEESDEEPDTQELAVLADR